VSTLLIKNGTIVTATDLYTGDVFINGDRIDTIGTSLTMADTIGTSLTMAADRVIDASGK
jgi:dihydroorotase-like cyclic amidohydrolase